MVKLFIGNLNENSDAEKLRKLFEEYGTVTECDILNRFGFVHMDSESAAVTAIENLHHCMFDGKQINVEMSTGTSTRRGGRGGDHGGGRGGDRGGGRGGRGGRERGGRGGGRGGRGGHGSDRYEPYPPRSGSGYDSYYDDPYDRRMDPYERRPPPPREGYRGDPYYDRDPYARYPPPERDPYARYPPPERDPYLRRRDPYARPAPASYDADPYARPPPEYYYDSPRPPPAERPDDFAARSHYPERAEGDIYAQPRKPEFDPQSAGYGGELDSSQSDRSYPPSLLGRGVGANAQRRGGMSGAPATNGRTAMAGGQKTPQNNLYMSFE